MSLSTFGGRSEQLPGLLLLSTLFAQVASQFDSHLEFAFRFIGEGRYTEGTKRCISKLGGMKREPSCVIEAAKSWNVKDIRLKGQWW